MKGVSAVIAVVMILMITVALSASAYVWFSGIFDTITTGAGDQADNTADIMSTSFSVASTSMYTAPADLANSRLTVYLANTGSSNINWKVANVYVDGKLGAMVDTTGTDASWTAAPSNTTSLKIKNVTDAGDVGASMLCGSEVKITYKSLSQTSSIVC